MEPHGASNHHQMQQQQQRMQRFLDLERQAPGKPPLRTTNDVSDIHGAKPLLKQHVYVNKPHFHDPHDIHKSVSNVLHPTATRRVGDDDRFKQLPIEGSTSRPSGFRTNRVVNPLAPEYKLPSFTSAPPVEPKFLRDSYIVTDIQGTSSKHRVISHPRDAMKLDDIAGAQSGWVPHNKRVELRMNPPRDILHVADIINSDFKSTRITNVLNPVYTVHGATHQDDAFTRPSQLHPKRDKPSYALTTSDIAGASCTDPTATVVAGIVNKDRRNFRVTNATNDIDGAHADTLQHSIRRTMRCVDPNHPLYTALSGDCVDASAISVGKSIVFADAIRDHDSTWQRRHETKNDKESKPPYVVASVGNVGLTTAALATNDKKRNGSRHARSAPSTPTSSLPGSNNSSSNSSSSNALSRARTGTMRTPAEKKQHASRQDEIRRVRELC